ncbi:helix-turn-helix domain-containing protein [Novosphingobium sp. G106]|uniref:MarR family transcriptional regulator n=1 Tax=Novosphingobium sp. G106 TaxID=2849500 RepID=UPI0020C344AD|nr:helix-turn-helix domain-containing protein [Novosphingobium sp. G106]
MEQASGSGRYGPAYSAQMASAIASCTGAISRLDARICVSPVAKAWARRAMWSGYAKALQLQQAEIDEIDVFSWGCGLKVPGRALRTTHLDVYEDFEPWEAALADSDPLAWRDALPLAIGEPAEAADHPPLVRAFDRVRQHARAVGSIVPWLALPFALRDMKMTASPLPCLAGGVKAFRLKKTPQDDDWLAALRALGSSALAGLDRIHALERFYRDAQRAIAEQYRPGALPALLALSHHRPLLSPQAVADRLGLSVAGASKLLERAKEARLLEEITQRRTWRLFLTPDLAAEFGYVEPKAGRPTKEPLPYPVTGILPQPSMHLTKRWQRSTRC